MTDKLTFRRPVRLTCGIGGISYDSAGIAHYTEASRRLYGVARTPKVYRCPNAAAHPDRPYHVGVRPRAVRRAA